MESSHYYSLYVLWNTWVKIENGDVSWLAPTVHGIRRRSRGVLARKSILTLNATLGRLNKISDSFGGSGFFCFKVHLCPRLRIVLAFLMESSHYYSLYIRCNTWIKIAIPASSSLRYHRRFAKFLLVALAFSESRHETNPFNNTRSPAGAAMADGAANQALMYSIPVKAVKHFRRASSLAINWNWFINKYILIP